MLRNYFIHHALQHINRSAMHNICSSGIAIKAPNLNHYLNEGCFYSYTQKKFLTKVRLKWLKNRGFDHIVNKEKDTKSVCMLKDTFKRQPEYSLPVSSVAKSKDHLGLTVPVLRFLRRFPTIFEEFVGPRYNVPWFRLTKEVIKHDREEQRIHQEHGLDTVHRLCKLLMMTKSKKLPLYWIEPWKWDLGLSDDYVEALVPKYSEYLSVVKMPNGPGLKLVAWRDELAVSVLQKRAEANGENCDYRSFKNSVPLAYEMNYPKKYNQMNRVKAFVKEWQRLPYISPYEDVDHIDPESDLMEKRIVGVLHELLHLTIHKKTERDNIRYLGDELRLPHRFTRIFTAYPGIFYLSTKCSTMTVNLREGYKSAQLIEKHPLVGVREQYYYMMRMGILFRKGGTDRINNRAVRLERQASMAKEETDD